MAGFIPIGTDFANVGILRNDLSSSLQGLSPPSPRPDGTLQPAAAQTAVTIAGTSPAMTGVEEQGGQSAPMGVIPVPSPALAAALAPASGIATPLVPAPAQPGASTGDGAASSPAASATATPIPLPPQAATGPIPDRAAALSAASGADPAAPVRPAAGAAGMRPADPVRTGLRTMAAAPPQLAPTAGDAKAGDPKAGDALGDAGQLPGAMNDSAAARIPPASGGPAPDLGGPSTAGLHGPGPGTAAPERAAVPAAIPSSGDIEAAAADAVSQPPAAVSAAAPHPPLAVPTHGGPAPSVATQILPSVVAMAQGHGASGRISVSITPDELGHVSITVDRASDGTTAIHVAAERLTTLDMLRKDQTDLVRALDQAGMGQDSHSLSFSWDGGNGGMAGWGGRDAPPGGRRPGNAAASYVEEPSPLAASAAALRGGVDITA
jgi:hypothetical protein